MERSALDAGVPFLLPPFDAEARGAAVVFPRPPAADGEPGDGAGAFDLTWREAPAFLAVSAGTDLLRDDAFFELFVFGLMHLSRVTGVGR